jgi:hypothetical protein
VSFSSHFRVKREFSFRKISKQSWLSGFKSNLGEMAPETSGINCEIRVKQENEVTMILKILTALSFLALTFNASAQVEAADNKLYIINQAHQALLAASGDDLSEAVQSVDRVELRTLDLQTVSVKTCAAGGGCSLAIPHAVHIADIEEANAVMAAKAKNLDAITDCRVCAASTLSDAASYAKELKATLKGMGKVK